MAPWPHCVVHHHLYWWWSTTGQHRATGVWCALRRGYLRRPLRRRVPLVELRCHGGRTSQHYLVPKSASRIKDNHGLHKMVVQQLLNSVWCGVAAPMPTRLVLSASAPASCWQLLWGSGTHNMPMLAFLLSSVECKALPSIQPRRALNSLTP